MIREILPVIRVAGRAYAVRWRVPPAIGIHVLDAFEVTGHVKDCVIEVAVCDGVLDGYTVEASEGGDAIVAGRRGVDLGPTVVLRVRVDAERA